METTANTYRNSDITVSYKPCVCINAERCARELSDVFRHSIIPWIYLDGATSKEIKKQIKKCPSGALQFQLNKQVA